MPVSRRQFCAFVGAAGLSASARNSFAIDDKQNTLRVIAYNILACTGWPKNRSLAKKAVAKGQMANRLAAELALYDPDIINFSESPGKKMVKEIAALLKMKYVVFPSGGNWPGTLLTRHEIVESENVPLEGKRPNDLFTRHWGRGVIKVPSGKKIIVHSAHLYPGANAETRLKEIKAMLGAMKDDLAAGHSMILLGDLNHGPDTKEYKLWLDAGWIDTFAQVGKGKGPTIRSDDPKWRIDYIMATGPIAKDIVESRPLFEGAFRVNNNDKESFALSDHLPQLAVFNSAR